MDMGKVSFCPLRCYATKSAWPVWLWEYFHPIVSFFCTQSLSLSLFISNYRGSNNRRPSYETIEQEAPMYFYLDKRKEETKTNAMIDPPSCRLSSSFVERVTSCFVTRKLFFVFSLRIKRPLDSFYNGSLLFFQVCKFPRCYYVTDVFLSR